MKVLLLVHIEESFRTRFPKNLLMSIQSGVRRQCYDKVIHFTSFINDDECVPELERCVDKEVEWGWGYEPEMMDEKETPWIVPSTSPHGWTWVHPILRSDEMKKAEILVGGGCSGECLENLEAALRHLELPYRRVEGFIYH